VLRGAGFAFRKELSSLSLQRAAGATFAFSSLLTPFFMGTVVGAIAAGAVSGDATRASLAAWTSPTALMAGFLFVAACGYLAAVYLVGEAGSRGNRAMQAYFARRAQAAAIVAGALSLAALFELQNSDPVVYDRLTSGRALPFVVVAGVCGLVVFALLAVGRPRGILRGIAALGVAAVVWGWGVAQYPTLLPGTSLTLSNAGAPDSTMIAIIVVFIIAVVLVGPSFALLYALQGRHMLGGGEHMALQAVSVGPAGQSMAGRHRKPLPEGEHASAATWTAALGVVTIAAVIRRLRQR
jgi:cytochrome d ubiquinol oxidase subunit II